MCELDGKRTIASSPGSIWETGASQGWVRTVQDEGCAFVELNDSVVKTFSWSAPASRFMTWAGLTVGTAVEAQGTVAESQGNQPIEIQVESHCRWKGVPLSRLSLVKKRHSVEYLAPSPICALAPTHSTPLLCAAEAAFCHP